MNGPDFKEEPTAELSSGYQMMRAAPRRGGWEAVTDYTPVKEAMAREESLDHEEENDPRIRQQDLWKMMHWLFGAGPHPSEVCRRLYQLAHEVDRQLLSDFSPRELHVLLSPGLEAHLGRLAKIFEDKLKKQNRGSSVFRGAGRGRKSKRG